MVQLRDVDWRAGRVEWTGLPTVADVETDGDRYLRPGDVLFGAKGHAHRAVLVTEAHGALAASAFFVVRPERDDVEPAYIAWYLNTVPAQAHVRSCAVGTKIKSVPKACLGSLPVPLPPVGVQRQIAGAVRLAAEERELAADLFDKKARLVEAACLRSLSLSPSMP